MPWSVQVGVWMRICLFFIIDGLKLEAQACLLLPTLRKFMGDAVSVIAYRRQDAETPLQPVTLQVLAACKVELRDIPGTGVADQSPWTEPYPIGNKILAASDPRDCDISVFIDTDMIFAAPINFAELLGQAQIAAVVSDYSTPSNTEEGWQAFYGLFDLPVPEERVVLLRGRKLTTLPYFNAGMILFRQEFGPDKRSFGAEWLRDAIRFDHEITYPYERNFMDQLTLPITTYRLGHRVKVLPNTFNFNIQGHGNPPGVAKSLLHYHKFGVLWSHEELGRLALDSLRDCVQDPSLDGFLGSFWDVLMRRRLKALL